MKIFSILILIIFSNFNILAQNNKYIIVTIEVISTGIHKFETDYWLISLDKWMKSEEEAMVPLYISGFSTSDFEECCTNKSLILFNHISDEELLTDTFVNSINNLKIMVEENRPKCRM